ncbi:hypothetical protein CKAH01_04583 [Colletotrichum kahawae]|uniref:Uncharacterized protein n=1 Tax=Colletotrichum kahawae TaxID=34407 RepID=A0AAD9YJF4_COLKA|nr:hypothetical protein CKAH01_04583 [Colletotrichum kahawae]
MTLSSRVWLGPVVSGGRGMLRACLERDGISVVQQQQQQQQQQRKLRWAPPHAPDRRKSELHRLVLPLH